MTAPSLEERVARVHAALYARVMGRIHAASSMKTRQLVETTLFVVLLHAVALLVLLHVSFVSPPATASASCLAPFLPTAVADAPLLRIQIAAPSLCAPEALASSCLEPPVPVASFVFASQPELLALRHSPHLLRQESVKDGAMPLITLERSSGCFDLRWIGQSSPVWDLLLDYALGYDTVLLNHVRRWRGDSGGVLLNEDSRRVHNVATQGFVTQSANKTWLMYVVAKIQTLYLCVSLFFTSVTLVDLARQRAGFEDYDHYTRALGVHCAHSLAVFPIVLGMVFFFLELYKQDHVLAFGVLSIISVGETFSIICVRTPLSRIHYPRLFFCWFALFHVFLCAYPHGFSHLALLVFAMTLLHTIMFFTSCFELPEFLVATRHRRP